MKIACTLAGALGGTLGQVMGAALIFIDAIRFGDIGMLPTGSAIFVCSWIGLLAAITGARFPRAAILLALGAITGLIVVALVGRVWSLGVPIGLLALSGGSTLHGARGTRPVVVS